MKYYLYVVSAFIFGAFASSVGHQVDGWEFWVLIALFAIHRELPRKERG